jgi:hypothetical protein
LILNYLFRDEAANFMIQAHILSHEDLIENEKRKFFCW